MGLLQNLIKGISGNKDEFKSRYKEAEMQDKVERTLEERKKSSNRRELESYYKKEEEESIKKRLDQIHHQQTKEQWESNSMLKSQKSILKNTNKPAKSNSILKNKHIFLQKSKW
jgi:hypothetical protein